MWRARQQMLAAHPALDAQIREQYFYFRHRIEESEKAIVVAQKKLWSALGLADCLRRSFIRPVSEPNIGNVNAEASGSELAKSNRVKYETAYLQRAAANTQCAKLRQKVDVGSVTVDVLLDAQHRRFDAENVFVRAVAYCRDADDVARNQGTLLQRYGIELE